MLIVTHFCTSATTLAADAHHVRATQLITRPGTLPTITIPVAAGRWPAVDGVWSYLREPAEFFGIAMPEAAELTAALAAALTNLAASAGAELVAADVVLVEADGGTRITVSGTEVRPLRPDAVRIGADESVPHPHRATDPWWRRMAARTTSRGELDQRQRWLDDRGCADGMSDGEPLLGALVVETPRGVLGVENPEPTSVLDQLAECGVITTITRVPTLPTDVLRAWWVSPRFETHPVAELAGLRLPTGDGTVPSFARWS